MRGKGTEVETADAYCRRLATQHYENFAVASWFLARRTRRDLMRVYAYCRTVDDLGDQSGTQALSRLARWRDEVETFFGGAMPVHPVLLALRETVDRCSLPAQPFLDLIAANEQDQTVTSYATWDDLVAYCYLSAAPVGRIVLRVFGMTDEALVPLSDDVCIGLQLANFAQDVARDGAIGRTYLLGTDLAAYGRGGATHALCDRARALLSAGEVLERAAPAPLRVQLALYRLGGLAICDEIARIGYRTDLRRPVVSKQRKLTILAQAAFETATAHNQRRRTQVA